MKFLFLGLSLFIAFLQFQASGSQAEEDFTAALGLGLEAYNKKNFESAAETFSRLRDQNPKSAQIHFNEGLAQYQLGRKSLAFALWRRALSLDPSYTKAAEALSFVEKDLPVQSEGGLWESFRNSVFKGVSLQGALGLTWICIAATFFLWIRHLGKRKRAFKEGAALPSFPWVAQVLTGLSFLSVFLLGAKTLDYFQPRATVLGQKIELRSAPSPESPVLLEIEGGSEVLLKGRNGEWAQIQPIGGFSGWTKNQDLFQTSGRQL